MKKLSELKTFREILAEKLEDPEFRAEWERLAAARAIATVVIQRRVELNLSQTGLAKIAGVSQPVIARVESGDHSPTIETLIKLSTALNMEIVVGITPAIWEKPTINVPSKEATSVTETTASLGSHLVVSAA